MKKIIFRAESNHASSPKAKEELNKENTLRLLHVQMWSNQFNDSQSETTCQLSIA